MTCQVTSFTLEKIQTYKYLLINYTHVQYNWSIWRTFTASLFAVLLRLELNSITYRAQHKNTEHLEKKKKKKKKSNVSDAEDKLSDVRECVGGV